MYKIIVILQETIEPSHHSKKQHKDKTNNNKKAKLKFKPQIKTIKTIQTMESPRPGMKYKFWCFKEAHTGPLHCATAKKSIYLSTYLPKRNTHTELKKIYWNVQILDNVSDDIKTYETHVSNICNVWKHLSTYLHAYMYNAKWTHYSNSVCLIHMILNGWRCHQTDRQEMLQGTMMNELTAVYNM